MKVLNLWKVFLHTHTLGETSALLAGIAPFLHYTWDLLYQVLKNFYAVLFWLPKEWISMSRTSVTHQEETRGPIPTPEEASWKKACCLLKFKAKSKVSVSGWTWKACLSHVKPQAEKQLFEELAVSCNLQLGHLTRSAFPSLLLHASIQGIILPQLTQIQ